MLLSFVQYIFRLINKVHITVVLAPVFNQQRELEIETDDHQDWNLAENEADHGAYTTQCGENVPDSYVLDVCFLHLIIEADWYLWDEIPTGLALALVLICFFFKLVKRPNFRAAFCTKLDERLRFVLILNWDPQDLFGNCFVFINVCVLLADQLYTCQCFIADCLGLI